MGQVKTSFTPGTLVLFYNLWTGWESPEIREAFEELEYENVKELKEGDLVWIDGQPYHMNGKVYGCLLVKITRIETPGLQDEPNSIKIHFKEGFTVSTPKHPGRFFRLNHEDKVAKIVDLNPLATRVDTY